MERRDIFKEEIERFGRALGKIISEFFTLKDKGKTSLAIEVTNQQLKTQLDIDMNILSTLEPGELESYLSEKNLPVEYTDVLVDYLIALADHENNPHHAISLYESTLHLYARATRYSKIYPFERNTKEHHVRQKLNELYQRKD